MTDPTQSRGYRNRNPGNIGYVPANKWQGQAGIEPPPAAGARARFAVFPAHEWRIRALAVLLIAYQDKHGLRTIREIISRWAPSNENATDAYIRHVADLTGRGADVPLNLHDIADLRPLVVAIITHELGGQPYTDAVIDEGLRRAGVVRLVRTVRDAAATGTGKGAGAVTAAVAAAAPAAQIITALGGLPQWTAVAVVAAAALLAPAVILTRRREASA
jgi:hypothetical protein